MLEYDLLELAYMFRNVKVRVLRSINIPSTISRSPIVRGSEVTIPLWLALILEKSGYVEIPERIVAPSEISKNRFLQMQNRGQPVKLDDYFYSKARFSVEELEAQAKQQGDIVTMNTVEKMKSDVFDLFKARLDIMFKAIRLGGASSIDRSLTVEEKVLVQNIDAVVRDWMRKFIPFVHI